MTEPRPILPLVTEEIEYLKWFEAFMHRRCQFSCCFHCLIPTSPIIRVELEQQMYADSNIVYKLDTELS